MPPASGGWLSDLERDALQELGNIGAGNATTALSQMLGDPLIRMVSPQVALLTVGEVVEYLGSPERAVVAVHAGVSGGLEGHLALLLPEEAAHSMVEALLAGLPQGGGAASSQAPGPRLPMAARDPGDMEASALLELGNVVITSYLNALGELTALTLLPTVPAVAEDMLAAVLSSMLAEFEPPPGDRVLAIHTTFRIAGRGDVGGQLVFVPGEGELSRLLVALGVDGDDG